VHFPYTFATLCTLLLCFFWYTLYTLPTLFGTLLVHFWLLSLHLCYYFGTLSLCFPYTFATLSCTLFLHFLVCLSIYHLGFFTSMHDTISVGLEILSLHDDRLQIYQNGLEICGHEFGSFWC
jgi:hypothetical protein